MFGRLLGLILLLIGLGGMVLSVVGTIFGRQAVEQFGLSVDETLGFTSESLETVAETLQLARKTIGDVNNGMDTVELTAVDLSKTISDTLPLLDEVATVASEDVPASLDAVQTAMPNIVQVAAAVDRTLVTLDSFAYEQSIGIPNFFRPSEVWFEIPFSFDLGIEYDPEVPFDESVNEIGGSLEGLPERLRLLEDPLDIASANLATVSLDILLISNDLKTINGRIGEIAPLLDEYLRIVTEVNDQLRLVRAQTSQQLETIKLAITIMMVWLGLSHLAPLYLGWELLSGKRESRESNEEATVTAPDSGEDAV